MKELGIIEGFRMEHIAQINMTRAEMAVIVQKAFELSTVKLKTAGSHTAIFHQAYWAYDAIVTMSNIDKTTLFDGNQYYAADNASREFFTAAIYNSMNAAK